MANRRRGRGIDAKGRSKTERFVLLDYGLLDSEAWACLSPDATKVLINLWRRHNGSNNGEIPYSRAEAHRCLCLSHGLKVSNRRADAALREIQEKGFAVVTKRASFTLKTKEARTWRLTAERVSDDRPTRDFRDWKIQNTRTTTVPDGHHHGACGPITSPENEAHGHHHGACFDPSDPSHGHHHGATSNIPGRGTGETARLGKSKLTREVARRKRKEATDRLRAILDDPTYKATVAAWNTLALYCAFVIDCSRAASTREADALVIPAGPGP